MKSFDDFVVPAHSFESELQTSRAKLLKALTGSADITLVRSWGNIGDQLIYAGTRRLLNGVSYREVDVRQLTGVTGDLAVLTGGGAWCQPYHALTEFFSQIENQFRQVVVFPSSFDLTEPRVRQLLTQTKGLIFARERVSYEQLRPLCHTELAHDCAFFFDYQPYQYEGQGVLQAFRTDREAAGHPLPPGNNDVSVTCDSLDEWLWTIARHAEVHTDRAHVMIAAALLGKRVYFRSSSYHKVPAIAEYALRSFPVFNYESPADDVVRARLLEQAQASLSLLPADFFQQHQRPDITIVMLSWEHFEQTRRAVHALREHLRLPFRMLLIDNGSDAETQAGLRTLVASDDRVELILLDENLGCVGGRTLAFQKVQTPYVLLVDNDFEVLPGAVEHLLYQLERHPRAVATTGKVVLPDGSVQLCGADFELLDGMLHARILGGGKRYDEDIGITGLCHWVPGCLALIRTEYLQRYPYDSALRYYFEDTEWCYRLHQAGEGEFYRVVESLGIHHTENKAPAASLSLAERRRRLMNYLEMLAYWYEKDQVIYNGLFHFVPELGSPLDATSIAAARILLKLIAACGSEATLAMWNGGELDALFTDGISERRRLHQQMISQRQMLESLQEQLTRQQQTNESLNQQLTNQQQTTESLNQQLTSQQQTNAALNEQITSQQQTMKSLQQQLSDAQQFIEMVSRSRAWKLVTQIWKVTRRLR